MPYIKILPIPEECYPIEVRAYSHKFVSVGEFYGGNREEGMRRIDKALELMPFHPDYSLTKAGFQEKLGDLAGAKQTLTDVLLHTEDPLVLSHLGRLLLDEGNPNSALALLEWADEINIRLLPIIHSQLARAYRATGQIDKAEERERLYNEEAGMLKNVLSDVAERRRQHFEQPD